MAISSGLGVSSQWGFPYFPTPGSPQPPRDMRWVSDDGTIYPWGDRSLAPKWRWLGFKYYGLDAGSNPGHSLCTIVLPYWFLSALPAAVAAHTLFLGIRRGCRTPPGCCTACGYDLRASPGRCPECGRFPPRKTKRAA